MSSSNGGGAGNVPKFRAAFRCINPAKLGPLNCSSCGLKLNELELGTGRGLCDWCDPELVLEAALDRARRAARRSGGG